MRRLLPGLLLGALVVLAALPPARAQSSRVDTPPPIDMGGSEARMRHISRVSEAEARANPGLPIVIQGQVIGVDRNVTLSYTNVFIADKNIGTMALGDGRYWLRGLRPGTYTLKARYISYEEGVANFTVRPGDVLQVDFYLDIDPIIADPLQVRAERKLLAVTETGTARRLSSDEIGALPMDDVVEMVALQPGVVLENNEIHVRGGRSDDTSFLVDGIGVNDPLAAGRYGVSFNEDLINEIEVLTGGFSAEYGQAVSGVVNVSTKDGGQDFAGKVTYKSDQFAPEANNYNTDNVRLTFSGPNLLWNGLKGLGLKLPGEQTFIVSASTNLTDTYLPSTSLTEKLRSAVYSDSWSPRVQNSWSGLAKLTWKFDESRKLNFTYSNQRDISLGYFLPSEGYPNKYQNILNDYNVFTSESILGQATWRQVLGDQSFYELTVGRQFSRLHSNKNGNDDFSTYVGPDPHEIEIRSESDSTLVYIAGAHDGGDSDRWHDHYSDALTFKGDYAWIANDENHFKTGFDYTYSEIQLIDLSGNLGSPPPGFLGESEDVFFAHPHTASAYVQDRLDYKGLVLNAGLRLDGWAPGKEVDDVMSRPQDFIFIFDELAQDYHDKTYDVFGRRWKARLSPRLGLSFPISPRDKFFFNYGHFNQWPRYNFVYSQLQTDFSTKLRLLGNPNLEPKVTIQYETGVQHQFDDLWSAGLTFYSNDIYGYAQAVTLDQVTIDPADTPDPNDTVAQTISPIRYFNADAARSLGVELFIEKRTTKWLSGRASFELQRSSGTNSQADATFLSEQLGQANSNYETEEGIRSTPLLWDRPWSATVSMDFFVGDRQRPRFFGWLMPPNWNANLLLRAWAGPRYTVRLLNRDGTAVNSRDTYGKLGPYRSAVDIKFRKWFDMPFGRKLTVFLEGRNILDHANYRRINPWTGEEYHLGNWDGDLASRRQNASPRSVYDLQYLQDYVDPSYRTDPRTVLMGVSWEW